jgi:hypothetical protein
MSKIEYSKKLTKKIIILMKRRKKLLTRPMIMKKPVMFKLMIPLWS